MGIVAAKCPSCGANLNVDDTKDAGICESCGTAFITEKAINNYITHNHNTTNVANQTNIYLDENLFEKEKRECKLLLMLLNKLDLQYLKEQALKVLSVNPDNSLAKMIYDCDFCVEQYQSLVFLGFDEQPLQQFIEKESGNIDVETSITFLKAILLKASTDTNMEKLIYLICINLAKQNLDSKTLCETYQTIATLIADVQNINQVLASAKLSKINGIVSMIETKTYSAMDNYEAAQKQNIAISMLRSRQIIAKTFCEIVNASKLDDIQKNDIVSDLMFLIDGHVGEKKKLSPAIWAFLILIVVIPVVVAIYFLLINL
ncbi:MAG: hypothetical protein IK048_03835 [Clostridia bacterium]|nr:hypothetical protein [Clostridia bacterium]